MGSTRRRWHVRETIGFLCALSVWGLDHLGGWWPRYLILVLALPPTLYAAWELGWLIARASRGGVFEILGRVLRVVVAALALGGLVWPGFSGAIGDLRYESSYRGSGTFEDRGPGARQRYQVVFDPWQLDVNASTTWEWEGLRPGSYELLLDREGAERDGAGGWFQLEVHSQDRAVELHKREVAEKAADVTERGTARRIHAFPSLGPIEVRDAERIQLEVTCLELSPALVGRRVTSRLVSR